MIDEEQALAMIGRLEAAMGGLLEAMNPLADSWEEVSQLRPTPAIREAAASAQRRWQLLVAADRRLREQINRNRL